MSDFDRNPKYYVEDICIDEDGLGYSSFNIQTKDDMTAFIANASPSVRRMLDGRCEYFFKIHYNLSESDYSESPWIQVVFQAQESRFGSPEEYEEFMVDCENHNYSYEGEYFESSVSDPKVFSELFRVNPELYVFACGEMFDDCVQSSVLADFAGDIGRGYLNNVKSLTKNATVLKESTTFADMELREVYKALSEGVVPLYPMSEGINISKDGEGRKVVRLTDDHDRGVRMGDRDMKTMFHIGKFDRDIELYSVFLRNSQMETDGNPLIYALKNENGWYISDEDRREVIQRVTSHIEEMKGKADVIVMMPSSNKLNREIAEAVAKVLDIPILKDKFFMKFTKDSFFTTMPFDEKELKRDGIDPGWFLNKCLEWERKSDTDFFRYHDIPPKYRKYITKQPFYFFEEDMVEIAPMLNGKRVMVIDDTVTTGMSLKEACEVIVGTFDIRKLMYVTLMSPLDAKPVPIVPKGKEVTIHMIEFRKDLKY